MVITNLFIKENTSYNRRHHCNMDEKQLQFVNELDFEKYGSGWQFLNAMNFGWWDFSYAIKNNLLTYDHNFNVNGWPSSEHEKYIDLVRKYNFNTDDFEDDVKYLFNY